MKEVTTCHPDLFKDELGGTVKTYRARLHVKPNTVPKFCKARPVPFAIKSAIEAELDQLESDGIITKVSHSEWLHPLFPFQKRMEGFLFVGITRLQ